MDAITMNESLVEAVQRVARLDISRGLSAKQARWLVDYYYAVQDFRIQAAGQARAVLQERDEAAENLVEQLSQAMQLLELQIKNGLDSYSDKHLPGVWAKSICGIGPVLAAGLLAHIEIELAPTVGHIWAFAGLDPTRSWERKQKRPWNAKLKVLCWKIGDSFVKQQSRESDVYGKVYVQRKLLEVARNEQGLFAEQAAASLKERKIVDKGLRETYEGGRLPAGRLDLRARRYAVKLFLAHYHHVAYEDHYGEPPPKPYILSQPGHAHFIAPPNWPLS